MSIAEEKKLFPDIAFQISAQENGGKTPAPLVDDPLRGVAAIHTPRRRTVCVIIMVIELYAHSSPPRLIVADFVFGLRADAAVYTL